MRRSASVKVLKLAVLAGLGLNSGFCRSPDRFDRLPGAPGRDRATALGVPPDQHQQSAGERAGDRAVAQGGPRQRGDRGPDPRYRRAGPGRANFYARLKGKAKGRRSRWCITWTSSRLVRPLVGGSFRGAIKDGAVWGRGALDMKGQGIIELMALIALKRQAHHSSRDMVFIGNADEESDGLGSRTFVERHKDLIAGRRVSADRKRRYPGGAGKGALVRLGVGEKRAYWQKMTVKGTPRTARCRRGDNPVPPAGRSCTASRRGRRRSA